MKTELKRELTLQDLAPYLPYELEFKDPETIAPGVMVAIVAGMPGLLFYEDEDEIHYFDLCAIKPLLYPLSAMNSIIPEIDNRYAPIEILRSRFNYPSLMAFKYNSVYKDVEGDFGGTSQAIGHSVFRQLYEWNFDMSGLLDAGLALNKLNHQDKK